MPNTDSEDAYHDLLALLGQNLPDLVEQIADEVNRGQLVPEDKLPDHERSVREERLAEAKLTKLGTTDLAVIPYSGGDKVTILCRALLTLAQTMLESRLALVALARAHELHRQVQFVDPDTGVVDEIPLDEDEIGRVQAALASVGERLASIEREVPQ